ncbi:MAG TPA: class I SAM-dependent methyltransferase [Longimicrobium sp.]|nr:class I SAM-dependent methyltransferase [Longimicrobium sp.]
MLHSSTETPAAAPHAGFVPLRACWVCGGTALRPVHTAVFELSEYARQDPELARYTGATVDVARCEGCGFGQPVALPALADYFGRMYDQRWSEEWMRGELVSGYKDLIFRTVVDGLATRTGAGRRTLLDLGAHVGRLLQVARDAGWQAEGVELNPSTAAFAARETGLPVHRQDAGALSAGGRRWAAATLVDVLEHIPDPVRALESARGVLEPSGWLAVKVPHGRNQLLKEHVRAKLDRGYRATVADNLVHVNHFGPRSLRLALERAGYRDVRVTAAPPELIPPGGHAARRVVSNAIRMATYRAARLAGAEAPVSLHLLAYARNGGA